SSAKASHSQKSHDVSGAIDGSPTTGWAINGHPDGLNHDREAVFVLAKPLPPGGEQLTVRLVHHQKSYLVGRFRLSLTSAAPAQLSADPALQAALAVDADQRDEAAQKLVRETYLSSHQVYRQKQAELKTAE